MLGYAFALARPPSQNPPPPVNPDHDERIQRVFHQTLSLNGTELTDEMRRGQLEGWDSLGHLKLVAALMDEFDVDIGPEEAIALETMRDVRRLIHSRVSS